MKACKWLRRPSVSIRLKSFLRDQEGQIVLLAALLVLALVVFLTVALNLAIVAHQRIQVQTAVDAAAMASAVWQIRGMNFVQTLNNLIWIGDAMADLMLTGSAISGAAAMVLTGSVIGAPAAAVAVGVGNVLLGISFATHAVVSWGMIPFRAVAVRVLFPAVIMLSGSDMAGRNGATPLTGLVPFGANLAMEYQDRMQDNFLGQNIFAGATVGGVPQVGFNVPIYAAGLGIGDNGYSLIGLHLTSETGENWPLTVEWLYVKKRLAFCKMLQPVFGFAFKYYYWNWKWHGSGENAWQHQYYVSPVEEDAKKVRLPPSTWVAVLRESDRAPGSRFGAWTHIWNPMGGLGVATNPDGTSFGELGVMGLASSRAYADPVTMLRFGGIKGQIQLVPVKLRSGDDHALEFGICH
jgi:hypothetical protein